MAQDDRRLELARTFDEDPERYAARRPTYPEALFDALAVYAGLGPGSRVLEIAPGTGQATAALLERGYRVRAVELSRRMADALGRHLPAAEGLEVVVGAFEAQPAPEPPVDAVLCATAWHWLDPAVRIERAAAALRPGGALAVVWTHHVEGGTTAFFRESQPAYRDAFPETPFAFRLHRESELPPSTAEQLASPLLTDVEDHRFSADIEYTTAEYLDLLRTYSETAALPPARRARFLDALGHLLDTRFDGRVVKRYLFELVLCRTAPSR